MQEYEVNTIIENISYLDKASWEQCRFQIYSNIQMNTKKKLNLTDILKFAWDDESENKSTTISSQDIERLKKKSHEIFNAIKNNG